MNRMSLTDEQINLLNYDNLSAIDAQQKSLFINNIDSNGVLILIIQNNQLRIGDRLLEIKTNCTSANLQWVTHSKGVELFRRICRDNKRVTLIVAHQTLN